MLKPLAEVRKNLTLASRNQCRRNGIFDNICCLEVDLDVDEAGIHTLKVYMVDPEVGLEKMVVIHDNDTLAVLERRRLSIDVLK